MNVADQNTSVPDVGAQQKAPRQTLITAGIAAVGLAFFLASVWTARNEAALVPDHALYIARFTKVAGCFVIAFIFRNHIPSIERIFCVGAVLIGLNVVSYAAVAMIPALGEGNAIVEGLSGLFSGLGEACIIILFAHLLSTFQPRISAVFIPLAYLLNEILYCATLYLPTEVIVVARPLGKVVGIALLFWCLARKKHVGESSAEYPLQYGMSTKPDNLKVLHFLSSSREWMLILAGTTLFPFLFGLIAQMCSSVNTNSGLYDTTNEFVAIGLLVLLVGYGYFRGTRFSFDEILYISLPLFATGCLLLPVFWEDQIPYAGFMVKCGYTIYQVLFWILLARKSFEDLRHTYLYFGIFYGLFELATAAARLCASALYNANVLDFHFISYLSLFSLWLIALYGLLFFAISKRGMKDFAAEPNGAALPAHETAVEGSGVSDFAGKFEGFCQQYALSGREREVLMETIHGYSMENIGKKLFISRETVKTHLRRIYAKVGVAGKQELISFIDHFSA